jgi:hypothetical protein
MNLPVRMRARMGTMDIQTECIVDVLHLTPPLYGSHDTEPAEDFIMLER